MGAFEEKVGWLVVLAFARSLGLKAFEGEGRGVDLDGEPLGIGVARLAVDLGELLLEPLRERPSRRRLYRALVRNCMSIWFRAIPRSQGAKGRSVSKPGSFCHAATIVC